MNWLTLLIGGLFIVWILIGVWRGFVKMAVSLTAMLLTLVIVSFASPHVRDLMVQVTSVEQYIQEGITGYVNENLNSQLAEEEPEEGNAIESMPLPDIIKDLLVQNNNPETYYNMGVDQLSEYVSIYLTELIITAIAYVVTFILVFIILNIVLLVLQGIVQLPVLKQLNSLAGGILALVEGLFILWVLCLVVTAFAGTQTGADILRLIKESPILSFVYNNNMILKVLLEAVTPKPIV